MVKESPRTKKYFNCTLQGKDTTRRAVCFSPERHEEIKKVEKSKSPIRLQHFRSSTSYGQEDIVILKHSTVTPIFPTDDLVYSDKFQSQSVDCSIADLSNVAAEQLVSLKGFVVEITYEKNNNPKWLLPSKAEG